MWQKDCLFRVLGHCVWLLVFFTLITGTGAFAAPAAEFRPDQILIQPKKNVSATALARFHALRKSQVLKRFPTLGRLQVLKVPKGETVASLIAKYRQSGLVEFAEPDYFVHANAAPNDPFFVDGTQWWLNNTGQDGGTPGADISAVRAWDVLNSATNIVVAVLDSGIRSTHQDLAPNMWVNPLDGSHGFNAFTGNNDAEDDDGHGTLVAGVLGAFGNNGLGVCGVAWRVQLMSCKCLDNAGNGSDSTVVECMDFARTNGARVMNCSFGATNASFAVSNAVEAAREAGIIIVASCGNGFAFSPHVNVDEHPQYPACFPMDNILSVAYTDRSNHLGSLSYYGPTNVDLAAPATQICSTAYGSDSNYFVSTPAFNIEGTSFAAPQVSAACALMLAKYPAENYQQIIARILKATDPLPSLQGLCVSGGKLNLLKALSPPINLAAVPATNGSPFELEVTSGANRTCMIQFSTDLLTWSPLFTNTTDTNGIFDFPDPDSANAPQRFYRAVAAP